MNNRYASKEDYENLIAIPPFVNAINSDGDLMAVPNPAYDDAPYEEAFWEFGGGRTIMTNNIPQPQYSEERWREAGRREMNTALRDEYDLPRYGSSRQPSTPPSNYEGVITESTVWHNITPPTPYSQEEEDHIEYERRLVDTILQETEKIRNTTF